MTTRPYNPALERPGARVRSPRVLDAFHQNSEKMKSLEILCADIGSVAGGKFGWAALRLPEDTVCTGRDMAEFVSRVVEGLHRGRAALGFECPLFVPLADEPRDLTRARQGEGSYAWSGGAGCGALATGLVQVTWILARAREAFPVPVPAFLKWSEFEQAEKGLFLWEAFVTAGAKVASDPGDAEVAVREFSRCLGRLDEANAVRETHVVSLVGAALLRTGWREDIMVLQEPCVVIKPGGKQAAATDKAGVGMEPRS